MSRRGRTKVGSIAERVLGALGRGHRLTATELAGRTGSRLSSCASVLRRLVREGRLTRETGVGPRGGYGYRLPTMFETVFSQGMRQLEAEMDRRVMDMLLTSSQTKVALWATGAV